MNYQSKKNSNCCLSLFVISTPAVVLILVRRSQPLTTEQEANLRKWIKEAEFKDLNGNQFFSFHESVDEYLRGILCEFCRQHYQGSGVVSFVDFYGFGLEKDTAEYLAKISEVIRKEGLGHHLRSKIHQEAARNEGVAHWKKKGGKAESVDIRQSIMEDVTTVAARFRIHYALIYHDIPASLHIFIQRAYSSVGAYDKLKRFGHFGTRASRELLRIEANDIRSWVDHFHRSVKYIADHVDDATDVRKLVKMCEYIKLVYPPPNPAPPSGLIRRQRTYITVVTSPTNCCNCGKKTQDYIVCCNDHPTCKECVRAKVSFSFYFYSFLGKTCRARKRQVEIRVPRGGRAALPIHPGEGSKHSGRRKYMAGYSS
jgi:hypothetical protein